MVAPKTMTEAILDYLVYRLKHNKYMVTTGAVIKALQPEFPAITNTAYQLFSNDLRAKGIIQVAGKGVRNAKIYKIVSSAEHLKDTFYQGKPRAQRSEVGVNYKLKKEAKKRASEEREVTALQLGEGMIIYVQSLKDKLNKTDAQLREALQQGRVIASQAREIKALEKRVKEWEGRMEGSVPAAKYKELHEKYEDLRQEHEALKTRVSGSKFNIGELHLG